MERKCQLSGGDYGEQRRAESQGKVVGKQRGEAGEMGRRAIMAYFTYSKELGISFFHNPFEALSLNRASGKNSHSVAIWGSRISP